MTTRADLPTRTQLLTVMRRAIDDRDAEAMHHVLTLLAIVAPDDAAAIIAVIEALAAEARA